MTEHLELVMQNEDAMAMQVDIRDIVTKYSPTVDIVSMLALMSAIQGNLIGQLEAHGYDIRTAAAVMEGNLFIGLESVREALGRRDGATVQ